DGSGRAKALGGIEVKVAQVDVGEVEFGLALIVAAQADALAGEDFAHVVVVSFVREKAAGGNYLHFVVVGIDQRSVVLVQAPFTGLVEIGRKLHVQRLVWPFVVERVLPALETALLGGEIGRGRLRGLRLQIAVHALMRTIVLRLGRTGELHVDALFDPPQAQTRQAAQRNRGKGRAM